MRSFGFISKNFGFLEKFRLEYESLLALTDRYGTN
jgi:hypothetical protein